MKQNIPANLNQSVYCACEIINYLTGKEWCRIKDIAEALSMDTAKVHRLLNTLLFQDFVQYDQDSHRYQLGFRLATIAYHMSRSRILIAAKPHIEWAVRELFETINLGTLTNDKAKLTHIYRIESDFTNHPKDVPLGVTCWAHETALGKSLLAHLHPGELRATLNRIEYRKYTETSITSAEQLEQELKEIRQLGYALDRGEIDPDVYCIAVPILSSSGEALAAVSSTMRKAAYETLKSYVLSVLQKVATNISYSFEHQI